MLKKYSGVEFEFLHANEKSEVLYGVVLIRENEMVLDIKTPGDTGYDIRGKSIGSFFEGRHKEQPGDIPVRAKWILLDDIYVGIWIESGHEYLFKFELADSE
jgi:hypothetical protein